ncbi:Uncharacterized conserved protein YbjQ, UPF0145 family [Flavobacterium fryxellicola]|uniref:UPF0145 protein FBFR_14290 n=1 Tax=Flavobacterium fryxellicola TaxID=249352 RepID=A0A167UKS9_9FLAO|nr:YbjQ family protein [Flavobacterium fryxellicola]OAB25670.1 hypothetical protein FBFR_14290 [Flavobacterium fryxellicola]SHN73937.1 Uncharacterized conserved protein YbjQ, UPF0145 family [Flavobacterium fryxellicola]
MTNPKDILVITTSSVESIKIKKYLKPVSAHIVAGTNLFSDFFGGLTDVFGGRSSTYQNQLSSLYNEAIERIKHNAHEIGGNCVIGLSIDMDEISGKGKSMFMLTAVGTAVVIEKEEKPNSITTTKLENVGFEKINSLRKRKNIIFNATNNTLDYDEETWSFINSNQVTEIFPLVLKWYNNTIINFQSTEELYKKFHNNFVSYVDNFDDETKIKILYDTIENEKNEQISLYLSKVIKELHLYDYNFCIHLLKHTDFVKQKVGLRIVSCDKSYYDKTDILEFEKLKSIISITFKERGERIMKKQLLSSKEKEAWICECSKTNEIEYCGGCHKDIYGFTQNELNPEKIVPYIDEKIELIKEYVK